MFGDGSADFDPAMGLKRVIFDRFDLVLIKKVSDHISRLHSVIGVAVKFDYLALAGVRNLRKQDSTRLQHPEPF